MRLSQLRVKAPEPVKQAESRVVKASEPVKLADGEVEVLILACSERVKLMAWRFARSSSRVDVGNSCVSFDRAILC